MCKLLPLFVFLSCISVHRCVEKKAPKVGVIGGGMGGVTAAYYLRQHYGESVSVDLYEPVDIGGRLATVRVDEDEYEAGGSIIHPKNQYMVNFTNMLGLKAKDRYGGGRVGLHNGDEMVFETSANQYVTIAKLLWTYGLSVVYLEDFVDRSLTDFDRIYGHQDAGYAFTTPEQLIASMSPEFVNQLHTSVNDYLSQRDYDQTFIDQFVMSALRTNYGQTTSVHAFVGMVALGGIQPGLWSVHGGNKLVPQNLFDKTGAKLVRGKVSKVSLQPDGSYSVQYTGSNDEDQTEIYDIVIIAAPLETSGIQLENIPVDPAPKIPRKFHTTLAYFVHGKINASAFGYDSGNDITKAILTTNADVFFNSVGFQDPVDLKVVEGQEAPSGSDPAVWKIFSRRPLSAEELDHLFLTRDEHEIVDWLAYPHYDSQPLTEPLPRFELADHLYYVNAIEWAASAMETVAIAGRNVALLAGHRWDGTSSKIDSHDVIRQSKRKVEL